MGEYFCGWYFKCQSADQTLAVIPAVHGQHGQRTYSIQVITEDGHWNVPFQEGSLRTRGSEPLAAIGGCRFRRDGMCLDLRSDECSVVGEVRFRDLSPLRYDIMGPFRYVPCMECRHTVFSMHHHVSGALRINGRAYRFHDDDGYIEGDRGRSFPKRYVWTQCCFPGGSLMLSAADIPLGPLCFTGVIGVVQRQGQAYRLATYLGASADIGDNEITVRQGPLTLTARLLDRTAHPLLAPVSGAMTRTIRENTACRARYRFEINGRPLLAFETDRASFEFEYPRE